MSELSFQRCEDESAWVNFLHKSPQGTRYCLPSIVASLGCDADYWFILRKGVTVAAVPVITRNQGGRGLPMHSYYLGVMFHPEAWNCKPNRRTENILEMTEFIAERLSEQYDQFELCLHPDIFDIRGFDWFNYHRPELGRVQVNARYTAIAQLREGELRNAARSSRRREEGYAESRENLTFTTDGTTDELISLWQASLDRQNCNPNEIEEQITRSFAEHITTNHWGIVGVTRDSQGQAQTAGLLMYDFNHIAHLPVVGTHETRYGGSLLYFGLMDEALKSGATQLDFNGANSPKRAYFKHSIGAESKLYFHLRWGKPT